MKIKILFARKPVDTNYYSLALSHIHQDSIITIGDKIGLPPFEKASNFLGTEVKKPTDVPSNIPVKVYWKNNSIGKNTRIFWKPINSKNA